MNKQTILGLVLIGAILFGFSYFQNRQQQKFIEQKRVEDSTARANAPVPVADTAAAFSPAAPEGVVPDSVRRAQNDPLGEVMAAARLGEERIFTVSNEVMSIDFSTRGGLISLVTLKNYKAYGGGPLRLWRPGTESFDLAFFVRRGFLDAQVNTSGFNFRADPPAAEWSEGEQVKKVSMRLPVGDEGGYVEFVYTIPRADYMIGFEVNFVGLEGMMSNQGSFDVAWGNTSLQNEKGFVNENNHTTLAYRYPDKKSLEEFGIVREGGSKKESEPSKVRWVGFKQHFFSSILIADDAFQGAEMEMSTFKAGSGNVKKYHARLGVPMERGRTAYGFRFYLGPNDFSQLKSYDLGMERLLTLGWMSFGWVTRVLIIPIFNWLGGFFSNFGWVILLMAIIVKVLIFPLTFTSYKSQAKMRIIKPELDEINARYPAQEDAIKKQQATMELYKRAGINPMAGCIPMLVQMPIVIAVFRFFPVAIELRGQRLWWADDLSSFDSIADLPFKIPFYGDHVSLFALLFAVSMFIYSWLNLRQQSSQPQMAGMKFVSVYLMPVLMLCWFNDYSSGLCFYYLLGNLFTIGQTYAVRFAINEDKMRAKMLAAPRKEKKKSGFMARLEEAQKAQLASQRQQRQAQGGTEGLPRGNRGAAPGQGKKKKR